jgi:phosphate transport system permease protein
MSVATPSTRGGFEHPPLTRSRWSRRSIASAAWTVGAATLAGLAAMPLFSVLWLLVANGAGNFRWSMLWQLPPLASDPEGVGGFGNAILGTVFMVLVASAIAIPFGILAAIYLAEFGRNERVTGTIRFTAKVLSGMPSILAGIFAYALVVRTTGSFSAYAGGVALSLLMIPIVVLTAEQAILAVPRRMKEAAIGMGATPAQVSLRVTLPTAMPSILTGVMLAVARAAGETAPLLFTAQFSDYWLRVNRLEDTSSLAVLIYNFSGQPFDALVGLAWTASLVLVLLVLAFNLGGQWLASRNELARQATR